MKNIISKRILSIVLILSLITLGSIGIIPVDVEVDAISVPQYYLTSQLITNGSGTKDDPYLISTKEEFYSLTDTSLPYGSIKHFKIANDIDFAEYYFDKHIVGSHYIDGNEKTLNNINMSKNVSLFQSFNEIKNITLLNMTSYEPLVADEYKIGDISYLTIANGYFDGDLNLGGIIADTVSNYYDNISVTNCHIVSTIYNTYGFSNEEYFAGGLFGEVNIKSSGYQLTIKDNTINKSSLSVETRRPVSLGGIAGRIYCSNMAGASDYSAGIKNYLPITFTNNTVGQCEMWVSNAVSSRGKRFIKNVGGIVGCIDTSEYAFFALDNCHNYGGKIYSETINHAITQEANYSQPGACGGIVGKIEYGNVSVLRCSNNTDLRDYSTIGGIVGFKKSGCELIVEQCYNRGDIISSEYISYDYVNDEEEDIEFSYGSSPISRISEFSHGFGGIIGACETVVSSTRVTGIYDCANFGNFTGISRNSPTGGIVGAARIAAMYNGTSNFEVERCYTTGKFKNTGSDVFTDTHIGYAFYVELVDGDEYHYDYDICSTYYYSIHMLYYESSVKTSGVSADYSEAVSDDYIYQDLADDYNNDIYATAWKIPFDGAASSNNFQTDIYPLPASLCKYATACPYDFEDFGTGDPFYADDYFETGFGFATLGEAIWHTQGGYWSEQGDFYPYIFVEGNDNKFETVIATKNFYLKNMSDETHTIDKHIMFMGNGQKMLYPDSNINFKHIRLFYTLTYHAGNISNYGTPKGRMPEMIITTGGVRVDTRLLENRFIPEGYAFNGWKIGTTVYEVGETVTLQSGYYCREITATWISTESFNVTVRDMGELYGVFAAYYGVPYPEREKPERYGYNFVGYTTSEDSRYCNVYNAEMTPFTCQKTTSHTIYAVWDPVAGDLNSDYLLSAPDLVSLRQIILKEETDNSEADTNLDGVINVIDLVRLKRYIAANP